MAYERISETIKIESLEFTTRNANANGQDEFLLQPTGSGKFEFLGSGTSDNKESD